MKKTLKYDILGKRIELIMWGDFKMKKIVHIGMDVGSTTVKIVVMNENLEEIYSSYERHFSDTKNTVCKLLEELAKYKKQYN